MVLTKTVETDVLGAKAYHVECSCGFTTKRLDGKRGEAATNRKAKEHADQHAVEMEAEAS